MSALLTPARLEQLQQQFDWEKARALSGLPPEKAWSLLWDGFPQLLAEVKRLQAVIAQHDLCHNLHGTVDARAFADGCAVEQRRLYGCAPDADETLKLRAINESLANRVYAQSEILSRRAERPG